jgi:hypothetical protein
MVRNELAKRLMWSALLAGIGALTSVVTNKMASVIWVKIFDEEPPED